MFAGYEIDDEDLKSAIAEFYMKLYFSGQYRKRRFLIDHANHYQNIFNEIDHLKELICITMEEFDYPWSLGSITDGYVLEDNEEIKNDDNDDFKIDLNEDIKDENFLYNENYTQSTNNLTAQIIYSKNADNIIRYMQIGKAVAKKIIKYDLVIWNEEEGNICKEVFQNNRRIHDLINFSNMISLKYKLFICDLLSLNVFKFINFENISYSNSLLFYYPFPIPSHLKKFVNANTSELTERKMKSFVNMINKLVDPEVYGKLKGQEIARAKSYFKSEKKQSIDKRSIFTRCLGLWIWDQLDNPLNPNKKDKSTIYEEALTKLAPHFDKVNENELEEAERTNYEGKQKYIPRLRKITNACINEMKILSLFTGNSKET